MKSFAKISIIVLMITFLNSCYKQVEFVELKSADFSTSNSKGEIMLHIKISNPNFYAIKLKESDLDIYLNDTHIGKIDDKLSINIPANSDEIIDIPLTIGIADILFNFGNLKDFATNKEVTVKVKGTVTGKALFFTKTMEINKETDLILSDAI